MEDIQTCVHCNSNDITVMTIFEDVDWGSQSSQLPRGIILKNVMSHIHHCHTCGSEYYTHEQSKEHDRNIRTAMVLRIIELEDKFNTEI